MHKPYRYAALWDRANRLRSYPREFAAAYLELQAEMDRELKETLRVAERFPLSHWEPSND